MLLTKEVEVKLGAQNIKYYEGLGYEIPRSVGSSGKPVVLRGTTIIVRIEDLQPYSQAFVDVLCDNCKTNISHIRYRDYTGYSKDGVHFCRDCANIRRVQTCMERYGCASVFQTQDVKTKSKETCMKKYGTEYAVQSQKVKDKTKQTCLDRYGVEHASKSQEVKEKAKQTCMEKYGVESTSQYDLFKEKSKQICLEKYGVEHFFQSDLFKEKAKQTCIEKYGVSMYVQTDECREKMKQTMLERYGVEYITQSPEVINKIKETNLRRYGVDCALKLPEIREKTKQTNLLRYGYEYSSQSPDVKEKVKQTSLSKYGTEWPIMSDVVQEKVAQSFYRNGTTPTSSQQLCIYNMLKEYYGDDAVKLNYPCGRCALDTAVFFDNVNIDVEYDGSFWHSDANKDRKRDEFVKAQGYRILRIKSRRDTPVLQDLVNKIEDLRNGKHTYDELVLSDLGTTQNECDTK